MASVFFFFKQKTAYEMRISDWSSDVCSSDLLPAVDRQAGADLHHDILLARPGKAPDVGRRRVGIAQAVMVAEVGRMGGPPPFRQIGGRRHDMQRDVGQAPRSEEHTSELQSLMRISYAVFSLKKKKAATHHNSDRQKQHR